MMSKSEFANGYVNDKYVYLDIFNILVGSCYY